MSDISDTEDEGYEAGRDGIIFLIDATESMFFKDDSGDCAFRQCLKACDRAMMHKIKFSNMDLMGVVFFGTDTTSNDGKRSHISVLQGLQRPCSDSLRQLRKMYDPVTIEDFKSKFGHNEDYLLADVLWLAQSMLTKNTTKLASSRILLLACSELFGKDDNHSQRQAKACAKDLHGNSISLDFVPCIPEYNPSDFIVTIMQIVGGSNEPWTVPRTHAINILEDIPNIVESIAGSKDQRSRCVAHLNFHFGKNVSVGVEIYNLIRANGGPKKEKLYCLTNEKISTRVVHKISEIKTEFDNEEEEGKDSFCQVSTPQNATVNEDQTRTVNKLHLEKCLKVGEETVSLSQEEYGMLKNIIEPSMVLLGFVPVNFLKITHHCAPASLVRPSKSSSSGSRDLFTALWHRMGIKEVAAICTCTIRRGCYPRFVALVPSGLEKDNALLKDYRKYGIQTMPDPQGFHIFFFPFVDNINTLGLPSRQSASSEQMSLAVAVLKKLRVVFHPSCIPNPAAETQWAAIEAIALDSSSVRQVDDEIRPKYEIIDERLGDLAFEFISSVYRDGYDPQASVAKKRSAVKSNKETCSELDLDIVEAAIKNHKVQLLNMDKLKGYLKAKGQPVSGKRKQALVDDIYALRFH